MFDGVFADTPKIKVTPKNVLNRIERWSSVFGAHRQSWKPPCGRMTRSFRRVCSEGSKSLRSRWSSRRFWSIWRYMAVCQILVPLLNIKIAGKWMFIPLKIVLIGIDPYPYNSICLTITVGAEAVVSNRWSQDDLFHHGNHSARRDKRTQGFCCEIRPVILGETTSPPIKDDIHIYLYKMS